MQMASIRFARTKNQGHIALQSRNLAFVRTKHSTKGVRRLVAFAVGMLQRLAALRGWIAQTKRPDIFAHQLVENAWIRMRSSAWMLTASVDGCLHFNVNMREMQGTIVQGNVDYVLMTKSPSRKKPNPTIMTLTFTYDIFGCIELRTTKINKTF